MSVIAAVAFLISSPPFLILCMYIHIMPVCSHFPAASFSALAGASNGYVLCCCRLASGPVYRSTALLSAPHTFRCTAPAAFASCSCVCHVFARLCALLICSLDHRAPCCLILPQFPRHRLDSNSGTGTRACREQPEERRTYTGTMYAAS